MSQPLFTKSSYTLDDPEPTMVSGEEFFRFFERKSLKLSLAIAAGTVGVIGNYFAVRHQIERTRFDMAGSDMAELYAFGLTALLELAIVVFHLMRIKMLVRGTTAAAIIISIYANVALMIDGAGMATHSREMYSVAHFGGSMVVSVLMAGLPIAILTYLMHLVMIQYDVELQNARNKS